MFGAVKGHPLPVLTNLLATEGRICLALGGAAIDEVADRIGRLLDASSPEGWFERLKGGNRPAGASHAPRMVRSAACQQIVRLGTDVDLRDLPFLQFCDRAIAAAVVLSAEPDSHRPVARGSIWNE